MKMAKGRAGSTDRPRTGSPGRDTQHIRGSSRPGSSSPDHVKSTRSPTRARASSPVPSLTPSAGALEMSTKKGQQMYLQEMHSFLQDLEHLTPVQRFDKTQRALLDMQKMVSMYKVMTDKSDATATACRKQVMDVEADNSRLKVENSRLVRALEQRDASLSKEKGENHSLKAELSRYKQLAFERGQQEAALRRRVKVLEDETKNFENEKARLEGSYNAVHHQLEVKEESLRKEQAAFVQMRIARLEAEKKVKELTKEVQITREVENAAWHNASDTRKKLLDGLDEALMQNPNHFTEFDLGQHRNRGVVAARQFH